MTHLRSPSQLVAESGLDQGLSRDSLPRSLMAGDWSVGFLARSSGSETLAACVIHCGAEFPHLCTDGTEVSKELLRLWSLPVGQPVAVRHSCVLWGCWPILGQDVGRRGLEEAWRTESSLLPIPRHCWFCSRGMANAE